MAANLNQRAKRAVDYLRAREVGVRALLEGSALEKDFTAENPRHQVAKDPGLSLPHLFDVAAYLVTSVIQQRFHGVAWEGSRCRVCKYSDVPAINRDLIRNGYWSQSNRFEQLAKKYPYTVSNLQFHAFHCIPQQVLHYMAIIPDKKDQREVTTILEDLQELINSSREIREKAIEQNDFKAANANLPHALAAIGVKGKVTREITDGYVLNLPQEEDGSASATITSVFVAPRKQDYNLARPRKIIAASGHEVQLED